MIDLSGNCVGYWKLNDDEADQVVVNEVGTNGVLEQPAYTSDVSVAGKINKAFELDGSNDYVNCGDLSELDFSYYENFTIALWFNVYQSETDEVPLLEKRESGGAYWGYWITYQGDSGEGDYKKVSFFIDVGSNVYSIVGSSDVNDGLWHFLVVQREGQTLRLYLDNVKEAEDGGVGWDGRTDGYSNLMFGASIDPAIDFYDGMLDNVMIFDKALDEDEIGFLWNGGNGGEMLTNIPLALHHYKQLQEA